MNLVLITLMNDHAKKKKSVLSESRKFVRNGRRKVIRVNRGRYKFRCSKTFKILSIINAERVLHLRSSS